MKKFFNTSGVVFDLQRFSDAVVESLNKTTSEGLSAENKEYYEKYLIDNAFSVRSEEKHSQGQGQDC